MPVEIPTREEIEQIIEQKLKQATLEKPSVPHVIVELEARITKAEQTLENLARKLDALPTQQTTAEVGTPNTIEQTVRSELGPLADLLQFRSEKGQLILKPTKFLGRQNFKNVIEILRKHGGTWSPQSQAFTIRR